MSKLLLFPMLLHIAYCACSANCNTCGTGVDSCTACSAGYYLTQGMCINFCPTGFTQESGVCNPSDTFVFHLSLENVILDIVQDQRNSIPVLTGKDNSFYPNYDSSDPIAAIGRGYYFNGVSSYMQLPPHTYDGGKELTLAPKFTMAFWVNPKLFGKELFDKKDSSNIAIQHLRLEIHSNYLYVVMESITYTLNANTNSDEWSFLVFKTYTESGNYKISFSVNGNTSPAENLQNNFYQDATTGYVSNIGAYYHATNLMSLFFWGFLWEFRIYNTDYDTSSLLQSSGCLGGCIYCPSNNLGQCLSTCDINEYWDDPNSSCKQCHPNCQETGCFRDDSSCNLCSNQLCETCDSFSTCQTCIPNASSSSDCQCDPGYAWNSVTESCDESSTTCTSNCDSCTTLAFNQCTQCLTNYYLVYGMCLSYCPSGYSLNSGVCDLSDEFVFHFQPHSTQDVVTDSKSSIPLSTGPDSSFYPDSAQGDPYPTQGRGYFFSGTSHMQYECETDCSPGLLISPEFTLSMWIKPTSSSGTLFSKQRNTTPYTKSVAVELDSNSPKIYLDVSGYTPYTTTCTLNQDWNFLTISTSIDSTPQFKLHIQVNTTCTDSVSLGSNWLEDSQDNYYLVIGAALSGTDTFTDFFSGFIWEARLYNAQKDPSTLVQSSNCRTCDHCPIDNSDECLSICPIEHFWNGYICENCNSEKDKGCVDPDLTFEASLTTQADNLLKLSFSEDLKVSLAQDDFEVVLQNKTIQYSYSLEELSLSSYRINLNFKSFVSEGEVVQVKFTSSILSNLNHTLSISTLEAELNKFQPSNQEPEEPQILGEPQKPEEPQSPEEPVNFYSNLTTEENNSLNIEFSEDLEMPLSKDKLKVELENKTIGYTYSLKELSLNNYRITLNFKSFVSEGEIVKVEFTTQILSTSNYTLTNNTLEAKLQKYDLAGIQTRQAREQVQSLIAGTGTITAFSSLVSRKPSTLWTLMNTLEILSYIALSSNPLTPRIRGFFEGIDLLESFRAYLDYALKALTGSDSRSYFSKFSSSLFMVTAATNLAVLVVLLVAWPFIWLVSKTFTSAEETLQNWLKEYKYNVFIRYWIQCYLDLVIACLIQLSDSPEVEALEIVNYASAGLVLCFVVATPVSLWVFNRKKAYEIAKSDEDSHFYSTWGALFYEFDRENKPLAPYTYFLFVLIRILLAGSLVLLGSYPLVQASINAAIILSYAAFTCAVRPDLEKSKQIVNGLTEIVVFLVFLAVMYFLNSDWEGSFYKVEDLILWLVLVVVLFQAAIAIFSFAHRVYSFLREKNSAKVANLQENRVVNLQENTLVNKTQGVNITTQIGSPEVARDDPQNFFRKE